MLRASWCVAFRACGADLTDATRISVISYRPRSCSRVNTRSATVNKASWRSPSTPVGCLLRYIVVTKLIRPMRAAGNIKTGILRHASKFHATFAVRILPPRRRYAPIAYTAHPQSTVFSPYTVEYGALTQLWAGTMPEALEHNGEVRNEFCPVMHICDRDPSNTVRRPVGSHRGSC